MTALPLAPGCQARVTQFAESREEAVAGGIAIAPQPVPDVAALASDDVLVEVESACVAYIDLLMASGQYHHKPPLPYTPGLEYAGVVRWVGPAVKTLRLGDRVMNDYLLAGPRSAGNHQTWGGWATYAVAPAHALLALPPFLSPDAACNTLLNYETAHFGFVERGRLQPGETVLVTGATGAAGLAAIQVAKVLGAGRVIATGRGIARLAAAKAQGADHVIDLSAFGETRGGLRDALKAVTEGRGADVLFDTVGGEWVVEALRCLAFGGRMVIIGWAANTGVAAGGGRGGSLSPDRLPTNLIQIKGLSVLGSPMVITGQRDPAGRARRLAAIARWIQEGRVTPVVGAHFAFERLQDALQARLQGDIIGGCAVRLRS
jgi:NADPH2:quinone reductase